MRGAKATHRTARTSSDLAVSGATKVPPVFSIGLTTYDRVDLLRQSVSAILNQTFADFELIINNDNPARTLTQDDIGTQDPRVRIVNQTRNLGQVESWRSLLEHANGRFFTWIADDDLYAPDFLEACHVGLETHEFPSCVYTSFDIFSGDDAPPLVPTFSGRFTVSSGLDLLTRYLQDEVRLLGNMGIFDRNFLLENTPWDEMRCEGIALFREYLFILQISRLGKAVYIPDALIYYRDHEGSWGSSNADIGRYYAAGRWLVKQSAAVLDDRVDPVEREQLVMLVFNLVLKQIVSKRKNVSFAVDVDAMFRSFLSLPETPGELDAETRGAGAAHPSAYRLFLPLCRQYVAAETGRIEKEGVILIQHDALEKTQNSQRLLVAELEAKEAVIRTQHDALSAVQQDHRLAEKSNEEKEQLIKATHEAREVAGNNNRLLAKALEEKEAVVQTLHKAIDGAENNHRLLARSLDEKEAMIRAQHEALQKAQNEHRMVLRSSEEKEAVLQSLHKAVGSAENNHKLLATNLQEKEAVVQSLHKVIDSAEKNHRLLASSLDEKEAVIRAQHEALQKAENEHRKVLGSTEEKEAVIRAQHEALQKAENEQRLMQKGSEEKEAVLQALRTALEGAENNHKLLATNLQEKEAVVQTLHKVIDSAETTHRLLARSLDEKEAVISVQHAALQKAESDYSLAARGLEEKEAAVQTLQTAIKDAESNRRLLASDLEEKNAAARTLQQALEDAGNNHRVLVRGLEEKEAVIQELNKAVAAYRSAFSVVGFVIRPANRMVSAARGARNWSRRLSTPRLGVLNQHPPHALRLPERYRRPILLSRPPKISIVTPSFNQAAFIERTIHSVLDQTYPKLEYFVQDGGSRDGTVEILKSYADRMSGWESRPDGGQSQAINLGFAKTSGEIMAWLNSDDIMLPGALAYVASYFEKHPRVDVVYGHRILIDEQDQQIGRWVMPSHSDDVLNWADYVPQETLFWRRSMWDKVGGRVDESFRFAMDWDLLVRFREAGARFHRLPRFLGAFRIHEQQKTSAEIGVTGIQEMGRIRERLLGRVPSNEEIGIAVRPYLRKHLAIDLAYRVLRRIESRMGNSS